MSVSGAYRINAYSYSEDDSIIVSTASTSSSASDAEEVSHDAESSGATGMTTDKTASDGTAVAHTKALPVMVARNHLLQDCPSDIRRYFSSNYVIDDDMPLNTQAHCLRDYALISKEHHKDAIEELNRRPAVCRVSTRNALPMLGSFEKGEKKRKERFDQASKAFFATYRHVYVDVSTSGREGAATTDRFPRGTREKALLNLLKSDQVQEFVLDVSHDPGELRCGGDGQHIELWSGKVIKRGARGSNKKNLIEEWKIERKERENLSDALCEALEGFSKIKDRRSATFALTCMNQPFKTFLVPVAQTLAECKEGLGSIRSLDLGFTYLQDYYGPENLDPEEFHQLRSAYANHLTDFVRSNPSLEHLGLRRNRLNATLLQPLVEALKHNNSLKSLNLSKSGLMRGANGALDIIRSLIDSLEAKPSLTYVNLADCQLDDGAADLLWDFLQKNPQLTLCVAENGAIHTSHPIFKLANVEAEHSDYDYSSS